MFLNAEEYYLSLENVSGNLAVQIEECGMLPNTDFTVKNQYQYFKFIPEKDGEYVLTGSAYFLNDEVSILDQNGDEASKQQYSCEGGSYFHFSVTAGQAYFIGIKTKGEERSERLKIAYEDVAYQWVFNGTPVTGSVHVIRGTSFQLYLCVDGAKVEQITINDYFYKTAEDTYQNKDGIECGVYKFTGISAKQFLTVLLDYGDFTISVSNGDEINVNWTKTDIKALSLKITSSKGTKKVQVTNVSKNSFNILSQSKDLVGSAVDTVTVTVDTITVDYTGSGSHVFNKGEGLNTNSVSFMFGFTGGAGTASQPYLISCERHLKNIAAYPNAYYKQNKSFEAVGFLGINFNGQYNGNGFTISGLHRIASDRPGVLSQGGVLFNYLGSAAKVYNVTVNNAKFSVTENFSSGYDAFGIIAGACDGIIENCVVQNSSIKVPRSDVYVGAICGLLQGYGVVNDCKVSDTTIMACGDTGGIVGKSYSQTVIKNCTIKDSRIEFYCYVNGDDIRNKAAGGIVGACDGSVTHVSILNVKMVYTGASTEHHLLAPYMGLVVGWLNSSGTIESCAMDRYTSSVTGNGCFIDKGSLHRVPCGWFLGIVSKECDQFRYVLNQDAFNGCGWYAFGWIEPGATVK